MGSFTTLKSILETEQKNWKGTMEDVAASPNDPVFINHHTMIDCLFEQWLQKHPTKYVVPVLKRFAGHSSNDCIVPFIPLFTHQEMFKTADNFGYSCDLQTKEPPTLSSSTPGTFTISKIIIHQYYRTTTNMVANIINCHWCCCFCCSCYLCCFSILLLLLS